MADGDMDAQDVDLLSQLVDRLVDPAPDVIWDGATATLSWASQNPRVPEPLRLVIGRNTEASLYWHRGYMYDFPEFIHGSNLLDAICEFLGSFSREEIGCGVHMRNGEVRGGGPVWYAEDEPSAWWNDADVEVRTWRGNRDRG